MTSVSERRRRFVNEGFKEETEGKHVSNKKKTRILKRLWREAKRDIN